MCSSRQKAKPFKGTSVENALKGAYIVCGEDDSQDSQCDALIVSTGLEVCLCVDAAALLKEKKINVRVVSAPCLELFGVENALCFELNTHVCFQSFIFFGVFFVLK